MLATLKAGVLVLTAQTQADREHFAAWRMASAGHVFHFDGGTEAGGALLDIGPQAEACREPINILFEAGPAAWHPIGNLALTPFTLRGKPYASIEGFWQGLKHDTEHERARVAALWGKEAKRAGHGRGEAASFVYDGAHHAVGGPSHRALMLEACRAKFAQNMAAQTALLATGTRPLTHRTRSDSKTIPGALMADIWMRVRATLRRNTDRTEELT